MPRLTLSDHPENALRLHLETALTARFIATMTTFAAKLGARLERYADPFANLHNMLAESSSYQSFNLTLNTLPSCMFR